MGGVIKQPLFLKNQWPFGTDGALVINSGETVTIKHGDVKD